MPGIARLGDLCSGHSCWPPRPAIECSPNVYLNGRGVVREGDRYDVHCNYCCCPDCSNCCHYGVVHRGSSNIFINDKEVARIGDPIKGLPGAGSCSSAVMQASEDTFGGG